MRTTEPAQRTEPIRNPLDEIKPRYKADEPPFPPQRRPREVVDDVAPDIDLDADFGRDSTAEISFSEPTEPRESRESPEREAPQPARDSEEERPGRRRRRRGRGSRRDEAETPAAERRSERPVVERPIVQRESEFDLDMDVDVDAESEPDLPVFDEPEESTSTSERSTSADEPREGGRRRRRRRRGGRDREGAAAGPSADSPPPRRHPRPDAEKIARPHHRPETEDAELDDDLDDVQDEGDEGDEPGSEHAGHKKIPTWAETVGILIDANMAARTSRQPDRGRPRRPRRDR